MSLNSPDLKEIKAIVEWVNVTPDIRELSLTHGDVQLFISRNQQGGQPAPVAAPAAAAPVAAAPAPAPVVAAPAAPAEVAPEAPAAPAAAAIVDGVVVKAPMVGIFYAAPKPGAPAFVEVGARVEVGSVLCIVEVMKLMNNIEAPVAGTVTQILVQNNEAVAYGQPIVVIKPDA